MQALGGDRASTERSGVNAAERPPVKEAVRSSGRVPSSMGSRSSQGASER